VDANPTRDGYTNLSLWYYQAGEFEMSIDACEKALEIDPNSALAYNNMGSAYVNLKEYDKAIQACEKALAIDPDYERAKNNLAWAQQRGK
jgi:tetratricopeptide (TPR) repeat protein